MGLIFMSGRTQVCEKRKVELGCKVKKEGSVACMVKPQSRRRKVISLKKQMSSSDCLLLKLQQVLGVVIRYQFLQTFSYPVYLFEIYDNFSFSKLTRKCHCFKLQAISSLLAIQQILLVQPCIKSWLKVRFAACYVIRHYIGP